MARCWMLQRVEPTGLSGDWKHVKQDQPMIKNK